MKTCRKFLTATRLSATYAADLPQRKNIACAKKADKPPNEAQNLTKHLTFLRRTVTIFKNITILNALTKSVCAVYAAKRVPVAEMGCAAFILSLPSEDEKASAVDVRVWLR